MRTICELAVKLGGLWLVLSLAMISPGNISKTEAGAIVVTTTADSGAGSFREALTQAGNNAGADTITFDPSVFPEGAGTTITSTANYVIEGDAASQPLTIDATGAQVVFDMQFANSGAAGFHFRPTGAFSGLTLRNFVIQNFHPGSGDENGLEVGFQVTDVSNVLIEGMTFQGNGGHGLALNAAGAMSNVTIQDSFVRINGTHGVLLIADTMDEVHVLDSDLNGNGIDGIELKANSSPSPSTVSLEELEVRDNERNGVGIFSDASNPDLHVTISDVNTTNNGELGIQIESPADNAAGVTPNDAGDGDDGINDLLNFPVLTGVGSTGVTGTACANCTVELFIADSDPSGHGEGGNHFATGQSDGAGNFEINGCGQNGGATVTATATDSAGNTSEYAENFVLPSTPPCVPDLIQGDNDCDGDVDTRDSLMPFIFQAEANQLSVQPNCPLVGGLVTPDSGPQGLLFGDVDCSNVVNPTDGLVLLQYVAQVTLDPAPGVSCSPIGGPLNN